METRTFQIRHMSCGHCVKSIEQAVRRVPGVKDARVTVGEAIVTTEGPPDEPAIRAAIEDAGYELA